MDEQHFTLTEVIMIMLYLGALVFFISLSYQLFIAIKTDKKLLLKHLFLALTTQLAAMAATLVFWVHWPFDTDIQFGPFLLPALITELLICPLFLKLFGYKLWRIKSDSN